MVLVFLESQNFRTEREPNSLTQFLYFIAEDTMV